MTEANRVFDTLPRFRRAAYFTQRCLIILGLLLTAGASVLALLDRIPAWTVAAAAGVLLAGLVWALAWRRILESAFWQGSRKPRRGSSIRLPLEALFLAMAAALAAGGRACGAGPLKPADLAGGQGLDVQALLDSAGVGGWIALALGALALLIALYLSFSLWSANFAPRRLRSELLEKLSGGDTDGARRLCDDGHSLLARAALGGLGALARGGGPGAVPPAALIEASGRREASRWRSLVDLLAAFGVLAPLAGLFGTSLGLLEVFSGAAQSSPALVAAGAVGALVPAVLALAVSLFALGAHYLFAVRLASLVAKCEAASSEVAAALEGLADAACQRSQNSTVFLNSDKGSESGGSESS